MSNILTIELNSNTIWVGSESNVANSVYVLNIWYKYVQW